MIRDLAYIDGQLDLQRPKTIYILCIIVSYGGLMSLLCSRHEIITSTLHLIIKPGGSNWENCPGGWTCPFWTAAPRDRTHIDEDPNLVAGKKGFRLAILNQQIVLL